MSQPTKSPVASGSKPVREVELTFDGNRVSSSWYDPVLEDVLCALCGKGCTDKSRCVNANPYCG